MHTPDESDPPRRTYELKSKQDFERQNQSSVVPSEAPTDVREMFRLASGPLPVNKGRRSTDRNQVHDILDLNLKKEMAAGLYDVVPGIDTKAQRRRRTYFIPLVILNGLALIMVEACMWRNAWSVVDFFMLAACGAVDAVLLFHAFVLRTE